MVSLSRRDFALVAGGAASAMAGFGVCRAVTSCNAPVAPGFTLSQFLSSGTFSLELGQRYLDSQGLKGEKAYQMLTERITAAIPDGDFPSGVAEQAALDFERGNLCDVDGWQLSVTECHMAGLTYLFKQRGGYVAETHAGSHSPLEHFPNWQIAEFGRWGPQSGLVDEPFNVQADGQSALWFHVAEIERQPYRMHIGPYVARTVINPETKLISASVSAEEARQLVSAAGEVPIHLLDPARGKQLVGHFEVRPKPSEQQ